MTCCIFSHRAEANLEAISDHIASDNPRRALSFVRELQDRCRLIAQQPRAAPLRLALGRGVRMVVFGDYLFFYRVRSDRLITERILHGARHIESLF